MGVAVKVNKASGTAVYVNGILQGDNRIDLENIQLPFPTYEGCAVVLNNEVHLLGGGLAEHGGKHYKWNGFEWISVSTMPRLINEGCAVVYKGEIHILDDNAHYKWNGSEWVSVSTTPYSVSNSCAVVYDNAIHILGSKNNDDADKHYKWDGTSWSVASTLPSKYLKYGSAVVHDNKIYAMARDSIGNHFFYSWDGTNWSSFIAQLPYIFQNGAAVSHDNKIYILGSNYIATGACSRTACWDGTAWVEGEPLPIGLCSGCAFEYKNNIYYTCGACGTTTMVKYGSALYTK